MTHKHMDVSIKHITKLSTPFIQILQKPTMTCEPNLAFTRAPKQQNTTAEITRGENKNSNNIS